MGLQTTIIIRNDALNEINRDSAGFVASLSEAINRSATGMEPNGIDVSCAGHGNPARVVEVHRADHTVIVAAGGSTARVIGTLYKWRWSSTVEMVADIIKAIRIQFSKGEAVKWLKTSLVDRGEQDDREYVREKAVEAAITSADEIIMAVADGSEEDLNLLAAMVAEKWIHKIKCSAIAAFQRKHFVQNRLKK